MDLTSLPSPILGNITSFTINAPDPDASLTFYQKLGFRETMRSDFPFPFIQITDDAILIMLRKANEPYIALTYYTQLAAPIIADLEAKGISFVSVPGKNDMIKRYVFQSPDGCNVSVVEAPPGFQRPNGKTMLTMDQSDYFKPETYTNKTAGMFGEFAQPVADLERSIAFWQLLGFIVLSKYTTPQPWAIMTDGLAVVGLHQATHFNSSTLTFFAADRKEKIELLKKSGIDYSEVAPNNVAVTTPELQKIFLFSMGG